jgi:hypothetical protein
MSEPGDPATTGSTDPTAPRDDEETGDVLLPPPPDKEPDDDPPMEPNPYMGGGTAPS